jgi:phage-related protein
MSYDFIWVPSYGSAVTHKPSVTPLQFGDGYEQRMATGINADRRKWDVSFASRPNATADAIEAFLKARGALQAFHWTPPHGGFGKWVCREWTVQKTGPFTRSIQATFEEIFEPG